MKLLYMILFFIGGECLEAVGITTMTRTFNRMASQNYDMCLLQAAKEGKEAIVKRLVESGCNINVKGEDGKTPLIYAIDMGHENIVKYLLERHCDVNIQTIGDRFSALLLACLKNYENIAKMLINVGANVNAVNMKGDSPLIFAVNNKNENLVRRLIRKGAKIDHRNSDKYSPIGVALACCEAAEKQDKADWEKMINLLIDSLDVKFIR